MAFDKPGTRRAARFLDDVLRRFDLADRWALHALHHDGSCLGMDRDALFDDWISSAIESNEMCYAAVQLFKDSFEKRFASDNCRVLTGCDFRTQEGRDEWEERNLKPRCREFVEVATELAIDAINTHVGSADA